MSEISKADWILFKEKLPLWQEKYMEKLNAEYVSLLNGPGEASEKFWKLEKKIKKDKKSLGVQIEISKKQVLDDLIIMINEGVIAPADIDDFSDDLKKAVSKILNK